MKPVFPSEILSQHIAMLGKTGSGKTTSAKLLVEQVVADGSRVCILDPLKSDWWGLTSSSDGKRPGLPFHILGGPRGHVPLHAQAGKAIGEIVGKGTLPLSIIDMADFDIGGPARFFIDFAQALFRSMTGVVYLVVEEAHLFAPKEKAGFGEEAKSTHWLNKIATGARSKGIRLVVCTQRTQALHNAVLGSCDTLIAHRLTLPADQKPVLEWLRANTTKEATEQIAETLSSLKPGEGWICSGEAQIIERRQFPRIKTFDNSATPTDDSAVLDVRTAPVDQDKLASIIGTAVEEAKANDPKVLRARIADLLKQLDKSAKTVQTDNGAIHRAIAHALAEQRKEFAAAIADRDQIIRELSGRMGKGETLASQLAGLLHVNGEAKPKAIGSPTLTVASPPQSARGLPLRPESTTKRAIEITSNLPKGEAAVLSALIQYPDGLRNEQLTVLTGYKRSSRDAYLQRLRERGYTERRGDTHLATESGQAALPNAEPLPTGDELQRYWLQRLPEGERVILSELINAYPNAVSRDVLSESTDYKRSSRDAYLQRLKAKQLVEVSGQGVTASETLF